MHEAKSSASTLTHVESSWSRRSELLSAFSAVVSMEMIHLDEAFLSFASALEGGFDSVEYLVLLDELASEVASPTVEGVARHLFSGSRPFVGNASSYYESENSLLNRVIDTRRGIPITLSVVMIEVARRLGLRLTGVGMPGHFLVGNDVPFGAVPEQFIDPFHGGVVLDRKGCQSLFERITGSRKFDPRFLAAIHPIAILDRALNNLKAVYMGAGDDERVRTVMALRSRLPGLGQIERDELWRHMAPYN